MATKSVYSRIIAAKSEPILFENENWFVLFAKRPCNEGHLLVIPKQQVTKFFLLPQNILDEGYRIATRLSIMLDQMYCPPQVVVFIKGFTNDDHAHIHVTPAYSSNDLDVDLTRAELTSSQMQQLAEKLKPSIQKALA